MYEKGLEEKMKLSQMANSIEPSLTRKLFNMASNYNDVINLTLGDPDLMPDEKIRKAAIDSIQNGLTHYSANAGLKDLRQVYASFLEKEFNKRFYPENIIVTVGGMEALYLSLSAIIDKDDEVIILGPYYVNYYQMVKMLGGKPVVVDSYKKTPAEVADDISNSVTKKTVAIIINSPCNPTGEIIDRIILKKILLLSSLNDFYVISDEVYRSLIFEGHNNSILDYEESGNNIIFIDSISKRFSMTGYRLGFVVANNNLISAMTKMQENIAACAPLPAQYAAIEAYSTEQNDFIVQTFKKRRDVFCSELAKTSKLHFKLPSATFYLFVDISSTGIKSEDFAYKLLECKHVAVVPGKAYGEEYDEYIRIAFTLDEKILVEAAKKIISFVEECI